jgi:hypothetical protein
MSKNYDELKFPSHSVQKEWATVVVLPQSGKKRLFLPYRTGRPYTVIHQYFYLDKKEMDKLKPGDQINMFGFYQKHKGEPPIAIVNPKTVTSHQPLTPPSAFLITNLF